VREDLAAPDAARLGALERARQAGLAQGARPARRLGQLEVGGLLGEPEVRIIAAGQRPGEPGSPDDQFGQ
jgi:hypothetical protein